MADLVLFSMLFLAMSSHSGATYCICKDGISDQLMQRAIDYACGSGGDCTGIIQNGACYNPNTIKNHCDYAVNSYFQKKSQVNGSCDFAGAAVTAATVPTQATGCVYPASSQTATTSTGTGTGTGTGTTATPTTTSTTPTTAGINSTNPTYSLGPTTTTGIGYDPNSATTRRRLDATAKLFVILIMPPMLSLIWGF